MNINKFVKRTMAISGAAALLTISLAGCAGSSKSASSTEASSTAVASPTSGSIDSANKPRIKIRAGFSKGMTGIGNQFGIDKGFYDKAGIDLELIEVTDKVAAFASGQIDVADGDPGTFTPAAANGVPLKIVGNMWRSTGAYWIIARPEIKSWQDLKGKTVGAATASGGMRVTTAEVLSRNGIDPAKDVELVANGTNQTAYATLVSGKVAATIIHNPYATMAEKEGTGHVLGKTWNFLTDYHTGVLVAHTDLIKKRPDDLQRVLDVYYEANEYARTHGDEFYPWAGKYLNISTDLAKEAIEAEKELWLDDPIVDTNRLKVTQEFLVKYNFLRDIVKTDNVVDNRFAEETAKKLKLGKYAEKSK